MNYETSLNADQTDIGFASDNEPQTPTKRGWMIAAGVILLLIIAAAIGYAVMKGQSDAAKTAAADDKKDAGQSVTVVSPGNGTVVRAINATGTLAARRDVPVGVVGEGGQVVRIYADAGDWVKQGQILVSIDRSVQSQEAASLQAQIGVARADLQLAENELKRALQLIDRGFISKADVDRRTATRDSARARVNVAVAQLNAAQARNARLNIRAPVGGYILERNVQTGQTVSGGSGTLFRIAQNGEMELQAQLGEVDLAAMSVGVQATVTPVGGEREFIGRIWQIAPLINQDSRQGIARIALPFDNSLRPGGFANVVIKAGAITAPVLPESAIQNDRDGAYVYIVDKENKAVRRPIKLGDVTPSGIAIIEGLNGTERVVLRAAGFLQPGETVVPKLLKN
ncbi:efflux RND transporter periplasmic adaptor subunit [Sphingorhabdus arenilitoris]|uniref:Efflux RND transporter periplasmic adaptor subunit n=1 Tax=Sphingorhabdus arenilitoris TaxID=1490041 RepID=A0ABV8RJZ6_9SPHN